MWKFLFVIFCFISTQVFSQSVHHGFLVNLEGQLEYVEWAELRSYNDNIEDSVFYKNGYGEGFAERKQIEKDNLLLLHPEQLDSDIPSNYNLDLTISIQDTFYYTFPKNLVITKDSSYYIEGEEEVIQEPKFIPPFENEFDYEGTLDTNYILDKLEEFYLSHTGIDFEHNHHWQLVDSLYLVDSFVDQEEYIKMKVDRATIYKYENEKLISAIGFDVHEGSVVIDSMKYDKKGNLIYLMRERAGLNSDKYYFKYDRKNRLIEYTAISYEFVNPYWDNYCETCTFEDNREIMLFGYNKDGLMSFYTNEYDDRCVKTFLTYP